MSALLFCDSSGLGDMLTASCAAAALQHKRGDVVFGVQDHLIPWTTPLRIGTILPKSKIDLREFPTAYFPYQSYSREIEANGTGKNRHQRYSELCGGLEPVLPKWELPVGLAYKSPVAGILRSKTALLAPFSTQNNRNWPLNRWLDLEDRFHRAGYQTSVIDHQEERTRPFRHSMRYWNQAPERVWMIVYESDVMVGNDSGISHLAGILRKPTLVLCGPTRGECVFGFYPTVFTLSSTMDCTGCYWHGEKYRHACNSACESLASLSADTAWDFLMEKLKKPNPIPHVESNFLAMTEKWTRNGIPLAPHILHSKRVALCHDCPKFKDSKCVVSGKEVFLHSKLKSSACPDKKW